MTDQHFLRFLGSIEKNHGQHVQYAQTTDSCDERINYIKLTAKQSVTLPQTQYDDPHVYCQFTPGHSPDARHLHFLGFQASEFALPVRASDTSLKFNLFSRPKFSRPKSVLPLLIFHRASSQCVLLAPLNAFHEQVLTIRDDGFRWGWSGDLKSISENFSTTLAVIEDTSPRSALRRWGKFITDQHDHIKRSRYHDATISRLSYWTDNGSAYWYRREPDLSLPETIVSTVKKIERDLHIPIASVEVDSWFYRHEVTRDVQQIGYLHVVPPTGLLRWEARDDVLPKGVRDLHAQLAFKPLILHSRHISSKSSYINESGLGDWWIHADRAHPKTPQLWHRLMQQASTWGAITYEQDWIVEIWQGVRQLRESPHRIAQWQKDMSESALENGLSLIWCMATPADMACAAGLENVIAVRSCDDYRYADDASTLWRWHLTVGCLIDALGLHPFKDVFLSHRNDTGFVDINGDPNALFEACLSALSAGPVGIGDRIDRTDAAVVKTCCRADGMLIKPDEPLRALDRSLRNDCTLLWADTMCGNWRYVISVCTGVKKNGDGDRPPLKESIQLEEDKQVVVYDWKKGEALILSEVSVELRLHEWMLCVCCPVFTHLDGSERFTLIGDAGTFATMGDRRIRLITDHTSEPMQQVGPDGIVFEVLGCAGEEVCISFWGEHTGMKTQTVNIPIRCWIKASVSVDLSTKVLRMKVLQ